MADTRLAALVDVANVPGSFQTGQQNVLANQLRRAQISDIPLAREDVTRARDIQQQQADTQEVNVARQIQETLLKSTDAEREEGLRTANSLLQVKSQQDLDLFRAANPVDSENVSPVFGSPEFGGAQRLAEMIVQASQPIPTPQQPDRTLVEVADPSSPTGTTFVKRSEAAGSPGKPASGTRLTVGPDGQVTLSQGRGVTQEEAIPADRVLTRDLQKDIISLENTQQQLGNIKETFSADFLTFQGKFAGAFSSLKAKANVDLSNEERQFLRGKVQFENRVEQFFNLYRKEITGAQAAVAELDRLKKSMLNVDQDPVSFQASLDVAIDEMKRGLRLKRRFLREGISIQENGDEFDSAFLGQQDDDANVRGAELTEQGLSVEQIVSQLINEGYTSGR